MWNRNVETFLGCDGPFEESRIVLFGAPFDSTTSYRPGTRFATRRVCTTPSVRPTQSTASTGTI